jgi:hypothetical protein
MKLSHLNEKHVFFEFGSCELQTKCVEKVICSTEGYISL